MLIVLPFLMILKGKNWSKFFTFYPNLNSIVDPLSVYWSTSNRTYLLVEWPL